MVPSRTRTASLCLIATLSFILPGSTPAQELPDAPLSLMCVDALSRVFPDRWPEPVASGEPLSVPRGGTVSFQFAIRAAGAATCSLTLEPPKRADGTELRGTATVYEVLAVPVEANNNGGSKTAVGVTPREDWLEAFIRIAPFEVAEVLIPADSVELKAAMTHSALVDVTVDPDAKPGVYSSRLCIRAGALTAEAGFSLRVHDVLLPGAPALHSTHWFFPEPENVTTGEKPQVWSEEHWQLIENSGRQMRAFGQDTILTPLIDYEQPLIQVTRKADNSYAFDFTRFDRWVEMFLGLGYRYIAGHHISMLPEKWIYKGVWFIDEKTGKREKLVERGGGTEDWLAFVPVLYDSLFQHLKEKGWTDVYIQHQLDEPKDGELYNTLAALARKHMPGIRTIDAINSRPEVFSPLVDIQVFALTILAGKQELAQLRRDNGQLVWLYHCCSPYPPYPNRHLDERLTDSRLYPWLAYLLQADGYLYWGANVLRGADPYKSSIGPVPSGSQAPGHPPGDNWMFYPGPDGLRSSMRMAAFRDGMQDHTLLTMLSQRDKNSADRIMATVARGIKDYEKSPEAFNTARRAILEALEAD